MDIQTLYATLLVGYSPCHQFTQVPGHTGGFYHMVCRHGVKCQIFLHIVVYLILQQISRVAIQFVKGNALPQIIK